MENKITITLDEYKALLLMSEKTAMIKKIVETNKYISTAEIKVILDIEETEGSTDGKA